VGEEWLYQAWSTSYIPMVALLHEMADAGRTEVLTLGVTPTIAAMLDDPYCLSQQHTWLADWQIRAQGMCGARQADRRATGHREYRSATRALHHFEGTWQRGASPVLRALADAGVIELLGGPAMHPFQPLLQEPTRRAALGYGLDDASVRWGTRPRGIWAPECGYRPGLEIDYQHAGITHLLVDGPTMKGAGYGTATGRRIGDSDVVAFARDLDVTYRVWSPRKGYPGGRWYRDFHTFDHEWGMRPARVTSTTTAPHEKAPYDPEQAHLAALADARDFVAVVRARLLDAAGGGTTKPLVVAAYDTELFGHWWHEGPTWLREVLRLLPEAGVQPTTLARALADGKVEGRADLPAGSWGSGKDWRVWDGEQVRDLVESNAALESRVIEVLSQERQRGLLHRDPVLDQLVTELLLTLSSDWAFMVTKDSAANYARQRAAEHASAAMRLIRAIDSQDGLAARQITRELRTSDNCLGHLDARQFPLG
jgi:1,4-alpha-glucan branching enzyme